MKKQVKMYKRILVIVSCFLVVLNLITFVIILNLTSTINQNNIEQKKNKDEIEKYKREIEKLKKENKKLLSRNTDKTKVIYLTFDDGPSANTKEIINILNRYQVNGTFFVINSKLKNDYKMIVDSGNKIGLHTYTHNYNKIYSNSSEFIKDLNLINNLVYKETNIKTDIYRFAGGSSNSFVSRNDFRKIINYTKDHNLQYFDWNCDSTDAQKIGVSTNQIIKNSTSCSSERVINLLMHDGKGHENTIKALPKVIEYYQQKGYTFKTLDKYSHPIQHRR